MKRMKRSSDTLTDWGGRTVNQDAAKVAHLGTDIAIRKVTIVTDVHIRFSARGEHREYQ